MKYITILIIFGLVSCVGIEGAIKDSIDDLLDSTTESSGRDTYSYDDEEEEEDDYYEEPKEHDIQTIKSKIPANRKFLGTFERAYTYKVCSDFPQVTRLYSYNEHVYIENNRGELIAKADIFHDGTFDFEATSLDEFGNPSFDLYCTCDYNPDDYYSDQWDCSCEYEYGFTCELKYEEYGY